MKVGKSIQEIRKSNGLSQEQFANMFHVTRQTVSNWENEKSYPDLQTLIAISEQFDVSLDKLMKEDPQMAKKIDKERKQVKIFTLVLVSLVPFLTGWMIHFLTCGPLPIWIVDFQHLFHMTALGIWGYVCYKIATAERKIWVQVGILNLAGFIKLIDAVHHYIEEYQASYFEIVGGYRIPFIDDYFENCLCVPWKIKRYLEWNDIYVSSTRNDVHGMIIIHVAAWLIMLIISIIAVCIKVRKSETRRD